MPMSSRIRRPARNAGAPTGARAAFARGFTLVELMTVVSIVSVLLGVCAPSFSEFLATQQAKGLTYDLMSDLILARNEALKRNASVSLARGGAGWQYGWTMSAVASGEQLEPAQRGVADRDRERRPRRDHVRRQRPRLVADDGGPHHGERRVEQPLRPARSLRPGPVASRSMHMKRRPSPLRRALRRRSAARS